MLFAGVAKSILIMIMKHIIKSNLLVHFFEPIVLVCVRVCYCSFAGVRCVCVCVRLFIYLFICVADFLCVINIYNNLGQCYPTHPKPLGSLSFSLSLLFSLSLAYMLILHDSLNLLKTKLYDSILFPCVDLDLDM